MSDIDRLIRELEQLPEKVADAAVDQAKHELDLVRDTARRNLRRDGTRWTGEIGRSMHVMPSSDGDTRGVLLATLAGHAAFTEYGTGAYFGTSTYPMPSTIFPYDAPSHVSEDMIDNLEEWVATKPITSQWYSNDRDLAEAIAHTIVELGTQAHPYLRPAWYAHRKKAIQNIHAAAKNAVEDTL